MCMFEEAKQLAEQVAAGQLLKSAVGRGAAAVAELMGRQAAWSEESANYEAAAEMYIKVRAPWLHLSTLSRAALQPATMAQATQATWLQRLWGINQLYCLLSPLRPCICMLVAIDGVACGCCRRASMSAPSACW